MKIEVGMSVVYAGKGEHPLIGKSGTVAKSLGDSGYEVQFGRDLWYVLAENLTIKS